MRIIFEIIFEFIIRIIVKGVFLILCLPVILIYSNWGSGNYMKKVNENFSKANNKLDKLTDFIRI